MFKIKQEDDKFYVTASLLFAGDYKVYAAHLISAFNSVKFLKEIPIPKSPYEAISFQTRSEAQKFVDLLEGYAVMKQLTEDNEVDI